MAGGYARGDNGRLTTPRAALGAPSPVTGHARTLRPDVRKLGEVTGVASKAGAVREVLTRRAPDGLEILRSHEAGGGPL